MVQFGFNHGQGSKPRLSASKVRAMSLYDKLEGAPCFLGIYCSTRGLKEGTADPQPVPGLVALAAGTSVGHIVGAFLFQQQKYAKSQGLRPSTGSCIQMGLQVCGQKQRPAVR